MRPIEKTSKNDRRKCLDRLKTSGLKLRIVVSFQYSLRWDQQRFFDAPKSCIASEFFEGETRTYRGNGTSRESVANRQLEWKSWTNETSGLTWARIENFFLSNASEPRDIALEDILIQIFEINKKQSVYVDALMLLTF